MYNEKAKKRTMKYLSEKKEQLRVWVPAGTLEPIKAHGKAVSGSMEAYIKGLVQQDSGIDLGTPGGVPEADDTDKGYRYTIPAPLLDGLQKEGETPKEAGRRIIAQAIKAERDKKQ